MSEGAVSSSGRCRVAACGHAEHIGWCCRRRRAGRPRLPSGRRRARQLRRRRRSGSTARCRAVPHRACARGSPWRRAARPSGCRRRPSCSIAAPCAAICVSNLPRMRGFSAWKVWCSAVPRWARWWNGQRCAMSSRCGEAGDCCCTMQSVWTARWRRRCSERAIADGARAVATIVHVAPDAEAALDSVRAASPKCGASAWDGMLIVRMLAADGASLRAAVIAVLAVLREGRPLPRVWLC